MTGKHCYYEIVANESQQRTWSVDIRLAIAPTKMMERMEWLAEKATEIGFDELAFLDCKFSERKALRIDRIEKIVVSAMKQSRKPFLPKVKALCKFDDFVQNATEGHRYIAHCYVEVERKDLFEELTNIDDDAPEIPARRQYHSRNCTIYYITRQSVDSSFFFHIREAIFPKLDDFSLYLQSFTKKH